MNKDSMKYDIMILNVMHGETSKDKKPYTKIGYVFFDDKLIAENPNFQGVTEQAIFIMKDLRGTLGKDSIFKVFSLIGEMQDDYKNPLNQVFKPTILKDKKANYDISLA